MDEDDLLSFLTAPLSQQEIKETRKEEKKDFFTFLDRTFNTYERYYKSISH